MRQMHPNDEVDRAESVVRIGRMSEQGHQLISLVWKAALSLSLLRSASKARDDMKFEYLGPRVGIMAMQVSSSLSVAMLNDELQRSLIQSMNSST